MKKRHLYMVAGLLCFLMILAACTAPPASSPEETATGEAFPDATQAEAQPEKETETPTEEQTEAPTQAETETETASPYLIPDPTRIDLTTFNEDLFRAAFLRGSGAYPEMCDEGVKFIGRSESRDPCVQWNVSKMYKAAGYPTSADGKTYTPFTPEEKKVIVFKVQAEWGGAFEMFYATEDRRSASAGYSLTEVYGGDSEFFGERVWQYIIFEADEDTPGWSTRFNDGFRLDYTNFLEARDTFLLEKIAFCADRAEAEAFIAADRGEVTPAPEVEKGFYVCLYEDRLHIPEDNVLGKAYSSLDSAIKRCDRQKQFGYRVANEKGEIVYTPYSLLQCNLLREGKYVTEYAREMNFKYGDSCTNPGINHRPLRTSCDRLVDWVLYRAGFTDQPIIQGCVVSNLYSWCQDMGFIKITRIEDLQAGDIIFVNPHPVDGGPMHVFMLAEDARNGQALRYDHGSDSRIMSVQPTLEPISYENAPFLFAYRPVVTEENNIYYNELYAQND
ncbi:MAG: hypothetical protein J6D87_03610 [Clostridia bacterium]|nr:hypothetical protein [Clostridia bacterium]